VSTVHSHAAGDAVRVPSGWTARTSKRLVPSERAEYGFGLLQGAKDGADVYCSQDRHSKVAPGTADENANDALLVLPRIGGFAVSRTSGPPPEIVNVVVAGVGSARPASSVAATEKV